MTLLAALFLASVSDKTAWYGPAKVTFDLAVAGNPYDAEDNDVEVRFSSGGHSETRIAYFDGARWNAVLATQTPGKYHPTVVENGADANVPLSDVTVDSPLPGAFVQVAPNHRDFRLSDGQPYWPLGHDLGWRDNSLPPLPDEIRGMGQAGCDWARIWSCDWDGKNPYWPAEGGTPLKLGWMNMSAYQQWDDIIKAAAESGVRVQWVIFHHGEVATEVDPEWPRNPWNVKNGGFLADPAAFFTDPQAIRLEKNFIRYLVARYGHETAVMGWELFNEVENTDAARKGHWADVLAWHGQMASYLRSIDPYRHLITTSSDFSKPLWTNLDYYQLHGYPSNVAAMISGARQPGDKPFFFGEVGLAGPGDDRETVRDAIWSAMLAGQNGAGEFWYWDKVQKENLYGEYTYAAQIPKSLDIALGLAMKPVTLSVQSDRKADLSLAPGLGWAPSTMTSFDLPRDSAGMGQLSSYIQGTAHPEMGNGATFTFVASKDGALRFTVDAISKGGARVRGSLDGAEVVSQAWEGGDRERRVRQEFSIPFSKGPHTISITNDGPDWAQIVSYKCSEMGSPALVAAGRSGDKLLIRVQRAPGFEGPATYALGDLPFDDGVYNVKEWDLDAHTEATSAMRVKNGVLQKPLALPLHDGIIAIWAKRAG